MNSKGTILCVEDDHDIRVALKTFLTDSGYEVISTTNGLSALDVARSNEIDFILLDMMMPLMSGEAFLAEKIRDKHLAPIPLAVMSAHSPRNYFSGAVAVLGKPLDLDQLLDVLDKWCRRRSWDELRQAQ